MKKLLPIFLIALFASCVPAKRGPYGCPKYVGVCIDTIPVQLMDTNHGGLLPITISCGGSLSECIKKDKHDTIPEWMHISMRPKGFVVAMMALSVRDNGYCIAHLDCDKSPSLNITT